MDKIYMCSCRIWKLTISSSVLYPNHCRSVLNSLVCVLSITGALRFCFFKSNSRRLAVFFSRQFRDVKRIMHWCPIWPHPMLTVWSSCSVPLFFLLLIQHDGWRVPGVRARNLIELPAIMKQEDRGGGSGFALWGLQVTIENPGYPSKYFRLKRGRYLKP